MSDSRHNNLIETIRRDYFLSFQRQWITDESAMKWYAKSRRIGITYGTSYRTHRKCLQRRNFTQWITSRDMLTAKEFVTDYLAKWAKVANVIAKGLNGDNVQVVDELHGITAFIVDYETGSRAISLSSTPEAFAGKGGDVLIDEGDLHKDFGKLLDMAMPCTTWGNQLEVVSALRVDGDPGRPFVQTMRDIEAGNNPQGWSYHKTTIEEAVKQGFVEKINEVTGSDWTREAWLKMMRAKCRTEGAWQSQYMIVPQDAGGSLLTYELIGGCEIDGKAPEGKGPVYIGMDIGRVHDLSVIWVLQRLGDVCWTRDVRVLDKTPYRIQLDILGGMINDYKANRVCIDSTGIGNMLAEEAQRLYGQYRVEPVGFTAPVKEDMAMHMLAAFEDRLVRIPVAREIREDLHKIRKAVTAAGNIRYEGDRDDAGHSDRFWALALALHAAGDDSGPVHAEALDADDNPRLTGFYRPDNSDDFEPSDNPWRGF
jgi:phage FluMu gp28-like protein